MNKGCRKRLHVCHYCIIVRRTRRISFLVRLGSRIGVEWGLLIGSRGQRGGKKKPKGLPDPSNVSLAAGIYMSVMRCLVSYLILSYLVFSCMVLHSSTLCLYPLEPLFLTFIRDCSRLWDLGSESTLAFILLGFSDRTLSTVGELSFPCCVGL